MWLCVVCCQGEYLLSVYPQEEPEKGDCDLTSLKVGHLVALFTECLWDVPWIRRVN